MAMMQAGAPPEIQFLNELLSQETDEQVQAFLKEHREELTPELMGVMADIADNMRENNQAEIATRLDQLRGIMGKMIAFG